MTIWNYQRKWYIIHHVWRILDESFLSCIQCYFFPSQWIKKGFQNILSSISTLQKMERWESWNMKLNTIKWNEVDKDFRLYTSVRGEVKHDTGRRKKRDNQWCISSLPDSMEGNQRNTSFSCPHALNPWISSRLFKLPLPHNHSIVSETNNNSNNPQK